MRTIVIMILVAAAAALFSACPKAREKAADNVVERTTERAIENRTGQKSAVDLNRGDQTVTVTGEEGKHQGITGPGATLPAGWPSELPAYPGGEIVHSATNENNGKPALTVVLRTRDAAAQVFKFYEEQASAAGYAPGMKMDTKEGGLATYETASKRFSITVALGQDPNLRMVSLVLLDR